MTRQVPENRELLTIRQAANVLSCSVSTFRKKYLLTDAIPIVRADHNPNMIDVHDLRQYIDSKKVIVIRD